ncbi:preprotein translocase subunit SecG [Sulfobacillus thermosulfidooxidans]|uniref:Protein-export membrane protein SecG n=1 Tax=Sulfobacillus thermosulfidooxidans (strain DSM 9293 / VKM B-1269 / AT-1) TaxID=929705 RepID=A0A1W1W8R6_SULTA|nr:preprotein translocase subunit SecG [Sulfobacillus thermosulfidooxidans]OLZ10865.1 preprotein translocase subunit SecG [Sulfobacillus thermosulfidooxidans]OLZ14353.1 preprotein translocase subunit SecG [Sulfobacillus thermosulfidooxidans]OLZ19096.1 preprotein translocase subunit SecG [Sulfobacillus thermosulfidooxidans]SMC02687.1 preprotein translocase subunit SecG [Sulfobacillus thermosulfidooxidans DSM 9293]
MITLLAILEVVLSVAVIGSIILQTGYSAGISGAFGGGGPSPYTGKKQGVDQLLEKIALYLSIALAIVTLLMVHYWR